MIITKKEEQCRIFPTDRFWPCHRGPTRPSSGCSWWKWRKPARSALKVEAVRTFGWLAPGHKFPVGQVDSKNVLLLERAVQNSRVWVMRGFHCCNFGSECPCPVLYVINERELLLGHASIVVIDEEGLPWVAPSLVLHYVIEHEYDPGRKFYDAPETLVRFLQNRIPAPLLDSSQRSW